MHTIEPWAAIRPREGAELRTAERFKQPEDRPLNAKELEMERWSEVETRNPFQLYEVRTQSADGKWGEWKKPTEFAVYIDENYSDVQIAIGTGTIDGVDPNRVYRVRAGEEPVFSEGKIKKKVVKDKNGKEKKVDEWRKVTILSPPLNAEGHADGVFGRHVEDLLRRVGFDGALRTSEWTKKK